MTGQQLERLLLTALGVALALGSLGLLASREAAGAGDGLVSRLLVLSTLVALGLALSGPTSALDRAIERAAGGPTHEA